jgi:WD40 repeat protein
VGTQLIAYVEANSDQGNSAGNFGDIVIHDLQSAKRFFVTHDSFFDSEPIWSPDGRRLAFLSNRKGESRLLDIRGCGGPHDICVFDLDQEKLSILDIHLFGSSTGVNDRPAWRSDGRGFYVGDKNCIYDFDLQTQRSTLVRKLPGVQRIGALDASPNGKFLGVHFTTAPTEPNVLGEPRLGVYNIADSEFTVLNRDAYPWGTEWLPDGEGILFLGPQDQPYSLIYQIWHPRANQIFTFDLPTQIPDKPSILRVCPSKALVGSARRGKGQFEKSDLFLFDPGTNQLKWLTDGGTIDGIRVFIPL